MASVSPFYVIGLGFSVLAALAAFLITYEEWSHHYPSKREPFRYAIEAAIVAFLVFMVLTVLAGAFVSGFISER